MKMANKKHKNNQNKNGNAKQKDTYQKQSQYFFKPYSASQIVLLLTTILAFVTCILLLVAIMINIEPSYYLVDVPSNVILYTIVILLIIDFIAITFIHIKSTSGMPSYDEFKKSLNRHEFLKKKSRFPGLLDFEKDRPDFEAEVDTPNLTLASICDGCRLYFANELKLYYTIDDIRKFVTSLGVSKTMILQGMSGTGKTSIAVAFGKYISVPSIVVPIQPMWKERSDLLGYYNEFTGKFNETVILHKLYEATFSDKINIIVLDEVNIARVEYYFSEFLSLLELPVSSNRQLVVAANGAIGDPRKMKRGKILLPDNVWFLGTANNDDSTFAISDKVYDRAMVMNLDNRAQPIQTQDSVKPIHLSTKTFYRLIEEAKKAYPISESAKQKIKNFDQYLIQNFQVTFGNRILMQLNHYVPIYIACGGSELEAIDDFLSKKTLRKLESKNPVYVKAKSQELISKLDEIFEKDTMINCKNFINRLVDTL